MKDPDTYPLQRLYDEASALVQECNNAIRQDFLFNIHPGSMNAFYNYPKGHAIAYVTVKMLFPYEIELTAYLYSAIGFYYGQMAIHGNQDDPGAIKTNIRRAGQAYVEAARMFCPDDEQCICKYYDGALYTLADALLNI